MTIIFDVALYLVKCAEGIHSVMPVTQLDLAAALGTQPLTQH